MVSGARALNKLHLFVLKRINYNQSYFDCSMHFLKCLKKRGLVKTFIKTSFKNVIFNNNKIKRNLMILKLFIYTQLYKKNQ